MLELLSELKIYITVLAAGSVAVIIRPVRGRACIESQGLISAEEGLIYSPVVTSSGRTRGQLRQLSPDQAALSRDTTWRYQARSNKNKNTKRPREDGRIIKLSDVPTDEEDDTLRGDKNTMCPLCSKSDCLTDLEAQPSLDPEEGTSERVGGRSQSGNNKEEEEEEEDESFPLINETNFGSTQQPSTGIKSLRRQYR